MFWQKLLEILHCLPIDRQNFESVHIKHYTGTEVILYLEKKYKWKIIGASFILAYALGIKKVIDHSYKANCTNDNQNPSYG